MKNTNMLIDVSETPSKAKLIVLAFQHVFAMFGGTILVPILVNGALGTEVISIPVALFASGLGTIIYILFTKGMSPIYLGSSFAFITPMIIGASIGGINGVYTGIIVAGLVYIVFSIIIKIIGKGWIKKLFPPIVVGPIMIIIGLSLAPVTMHQIGLVGNETLSWQPIVIASAAFLATAITGIYAKGFWKAILFLVGILTGFTISVALGMINFNALTDASWLTIPKFILPFKDYSLSIGALIVIVPVALVTIAEHIGTHITMSKIIDKDLLEDPGLDNTLLGDGIATAVAGMIGGPANTSYSENVAVVGLTKVASIFVICLTALIVITMAFLGKLTAIIALIPDSVFGGVSIILYGFISVNGLKLLIQNKVDLDKTKNIIVVASMLVFGLSGSAVSILLGNFSLALSGMSLAAIIGILLNLLFVEKNS